MKQYKKKEKKTECTREGNRKKHTEEKGKRNKDKKQKTKKMEG